MRKKKNRRRKPQQTSNSFTAKLKLEYQKFKARNFYSKLAIIASICCISGFIIKFLPNEDSSKLEEVFQVTQDLNLQNHKADKFIVDKKLIEDKVDMQYDQVINIAKKAKIKSNDLMTRSNAEFILKNYSRAAKLLLEAAEKENIKALYKMAFFYEYGIGVNKNGKKSFEFTKRAADYGLLEAEARLGDIYNHGHMGIPINNMKSAFWFSKAAKKNDINSIFRLAELYRYGKGIPMNLIKAEELYSEAANNGHTEAMLQLSSMKLKSTMNEFEAMEYLELLSKSADMGNNKAQYLLGLLYINGYGLVEIDQKKGRTLLLKSFNNGYSIAARDLGKFFISGKYGFEVDSAAAKLFLIAGSLYKDSLSKVYLDSIFPVSQTVENSDNNKLQFRYGIDSARVFNHIQNIMND